MSLTLRLDDGTELPYDERKVAEQIYAAQQKVGIDDRALADEHAGLTTLFLESTYGVFLSQRDLDEMVRKVLFETGHMLTSRAYIENRQL
ncbi:hypothetical protein KY331_01560 [Candidatus Woesearchaeota archaeon]|nr:hypothetical protein [Candidatus Woesearchaeota archaeon]